VIGRGRHVRPVRFHIGEVQHPRLLALLAYEVRGPVGHVGRFRVLFLHPGRVAHVPHLPAARYRAVGLPDDLLNILKDDLWQRDECSVEIR